MKGKIIIDRELCKGCGFCMQACPGGLIAFDGSLNSMSYHPAQPLYIERCTGCGLCAIVCPDIAIEVWRENKQNQKSKIKNQNYGKEKK